MKIILIVLVYVIGYLAHDYKMVKDCEKVGYTGTLVWKTGLNCSVNIRD